MLRAIILRTINAFLIAFAIVRLIFVRLIFQALLYFIICIVKLRNLDIKVVIFFLSINLFAIFALITRTISDAYLLI